MISRYSNVVNIIKEAVSNGKYLTKKVLSGYLHQRLINTLRFEDF